MKVLKRGSSGPSVELLQLALNRAGFGSLETDGLFGPETERALRTFQKSRGITSDGIAGSESHRRLLPWYMGYISRRLRPGEEASALAESCGCDIRRLLAANPGLENGALRPGDTVVLPLPFEVVPENIRLSSALVNFCVRGLSARYPFISLSEAGKSVMGRPLWQLMLGRGENRVLYTAGQHANEWITSLLLLKFTEQLAAAYVDGESIYGESAAAILDYARLCILPALNPDGIDFVTGELSDGPFYRAARDIAAAYPHFSFPEGWKANIRGTDLNLQFPAGWERAREIKYSQGIRGPAPADFVGPSVLSAPESRALYELTLRFDPALILAFHTQGEVIYWKYLDIIPPMAREIGSVFSELSGYALEDTPYASGFAGFKDWFIDAFRRPGYTLEAGLGQNPLPLSDFPSIYGKNLGIMTYGALVT